MAMADDQIEEFFLQQGILNATQHGGRVTFADLRHHDPDGEAAPLAETAGKGVRFVIERGRRAHYSFLCCWGDAKLTTAMIEHPRYRRWRQFQMSGKLAQPHPQDAFHIVAWRPLVPFCISLSDLDLLLLVCRSPEFARCRCWATTGSSPSWSRFPGLP